MKAALKISVLLNVGLLACLVLQTLKQPNLPVEPAQPVVIATHPVATETVSQNSARARPEPIQWNQLYAKDYRVYVRNLRAIGCPERTLRAIVAADVHAAFQQKTDELEKKLSDIGKGSWADQLGAWKSRDALQKELLQMPEAEAATLADCLGERVTGTATLAQNNPPQSETVDEPIVAPLVAQPVDLAVLNLDEGQLKAITDLQQMFLDKIGGPDQNPNDPAYRLRWRSAQAEVDNLMQGMIGNQAYQDFQLQAFAIAQAQTPQPEDSSTASSKMGD